MSDGDVDPPVGVQLDALRTNLERLGHRAARQELNDGGRCRCSAQSAGTVVGMRLGEARGTDEGYQCGAGEGGDGARPAGDADARLLPVPVLIELSLGVVFRSGHDCSYLMTAGGLPTVAMHARVVKDRSPAGVVSVKVW